MKSQHNRILVVDDEAAMREVLRARLEQWGFEVATAEDGAEARCLVKEVRPDMAISDVVLPDVSGLDLVKGLQLGDPERPVVLITAYGTVDTAVEAMKRGAIDFLTKPLDYDKLKITLRHAQERLNGRSEADRTGSPLAHEKGMGLLVGRSRPMTEVYEALRILGNSDAPAIVTGDSGTGKELAARTIHDGSARRSGPFVAVNTAAIAEGVMESELFGHVKGSFTGASADRPGFFELADGGTLFLDEISEMPAQLQPKLLRVLEDSRVRRVGGRREVRVDVRVLAATNRDPEEALGEGRLRSDLYYRLSVFTVRLPPLDDRLEDVPLLCSHFVAQFNDKHGTTVAGISQEVMESLQGYQWPGNVRELKNVVERAVILARQGWIGVAHLPPYLRGVTEPQATGLRLPEDVTVAEAEKLLILHTLERVDQNKTKAARVLGVDVKTIRNKLRAYGMIADRG
jgi:DNA-binding NtrC family response regulator